MNSVRVDVIGGIKLIVTEYFGYSQDEIQTLTGFDFSSFNDPHNTCSLDAAIQLLEDCAKITECDYFGALAARQQTLNSMGMLPLIGEHSDSFGNAINDLFSNNRLNVSGVHWFAAREKKYTCLNVNIQSIRPLKQAYLFAMTQAHILFSSIIENKWYALQTCFTCDKPANYRYWRQLFGENLHFNMDFNGFVVDNSLFSMKNAKRNQRISSVINDYLKLTGKTQSTDRIEQIKMSIRSMLVLNQRCKLNDLASSQNVSVRAFQNYLQQHKLTFQQLLDDVRYELARDLLVNSEHSMSNISEMIGFSDAAVFTRAFNKAVGQTPLQYRKQHTS